VSAALCRDDASGSLPLGDGPKSAAFRNGVAQFGMALLPTQMNSRESTVDPPRSRGSSILIPSHHEIAIA
jgi:hypothetical protein